MKKKCASTEEAKINKIPNNKTNKTLTATRFCASENKYNNNKRKTTTTTTNDADDGVDDVDGSKGSGCGLCASLARSGGACAMWALKRRRRHHNNNNRTMAKIAEKKREAKKSKKPKWPAGCSIYLFFFSF